MYWVDTITDSIIDSCKDKIAAKKTLIVRDEKTASGRVHVGSLRGVAIHGILAEVLQEKGIDCTYLFEINDFDPMDGLPVYLDKATFEPYMGKPLCEVPSPTPETNNDESSHHLPVGENFAEYYAQEFVGVIKKIGFEPKLYRSSTLYKNGSYNEVIKLALENSEKIKEIYKRVSGSVKEGNWLPVQMICEKCGKVSTTLATAFDGEKVTYTCRDLTWTNGCGYSGSNSPFNGNAKLPWKIEWAAKFKILDVDVEGGGKDHSTKGGSRDVAETIAREVFNWQPPYNIPYEFFQVGGKKMSSSKGRGSFSGEIAELLPAEILRLLLLQKEPQRVIEFIPDGDTVPILFDTYDKFATGYFGGDTTDYSRMFTLMHPVVDRALLSQKIMPRFSQIAFLSQMSHLDIKKEVEHIVEKTLTEEDTKELEKRLHYAKIWIDTYAPEDYKFEIKDTVPEAAKNLSEIQKKALGEILLYTKSAAILDGQAFHTELHELKTRINIEPRELFEAIYLSILGKPSGPKAGWFLSVMDKDFLIKRLSDVVGL